MAPILGAQAPPSQEVVLSTSAGSKLGVAVPAPKVRRAPGHRGQGYPRGPQPGPGGGRPFQRTCGTSCPPPPIPASYAAWAATGAEWVVTSSVSRAAGGDVEVMIQVVDVLAAQSKGANAVFSKRYTGRETALRRIAHRIADDLMAQLTGEEGVASTRIVFVKQVRPGVKEIYQVDRDGANAFPLTAYHSLTISPSVAPDGRLAL